MSKHIIIDKISHLLQSKKILENKEIEVKDFFIQLSEESHKILILCLCIPFLQPIPIPGLSTPLGILIGVTSFFDLVKGPIWLPEFIQKKKMTEGQLLKISIFLNQFFSKLSFVKPGRLILLNSKLFYIFDHFVIFLSAFILSLPLPIPFSNTLPGWTIFLLTWAELEEDGLFKILGWFLFILMAFFFLSLNEGLQWGINFIQNLF